MQSPPGLLRCLCSDISRRLSFAQVGQDPSAGLQRQRQFCLGICSAATLTEHLARSCLTLACRLGIAWLLMLLRRLTVADSMRAGGRLITATRRLDWSEAKSLCVVAVHSQQQEGDTDALHVVQVSSFCASLCCRIIKSTQGD